MRSHFQTQTGSVTAEFAIVLPTVVLVASTLIGGLALGAVKVQLSGAAATLARAAARGESVDPLAKDLGVQHKEVWQTELVCVHATKTLLLKLEEVSCTRKGGL